MIMPQFIAKGHAKLVERFLTTEHNRHYDNNKTVWIKHTRGYIQPMNMQMQTCISEEKGMFIVAFFENIE